MVAVYLGAGSGAQAEGVAGEDGEGFNIAHPFGKSGPTIQCSSSLPDSAVRSLRAGGGPHIGTYARDTDVFVFLQKRW
jgi:hypothetical protein